MLLCHIVIHLFIAISHSESTSTQTYFVSKLGHDHESCGDTDSNACGTLYYTSMLINEMTETYVNINIIDGTNATDIKHYQTAQNTNSSDPCLPIPFNDNIHLNIEFNSKTFSDWYPKNLCQNTNQNITYNNEYIFDGAHDIIINNLVIDNYSSSRFYNFIRITDKHDSTGFSCNNCNFSNIISIKHSPLFDIYGSVVLINNIFQNITCFTDCIYINDNRENSMVTLQQCTFKYITSDQSLLNLVRDLDSGVTLTSIVVENSVFENIFVGNSIVNDLMVQSVVNISNTIIDEIYGSIYYSNHGRTSNIYIENVSISTSQTNDLSKDKGLFDFGSTDYAYINNMDVEYHYDMIRSCQYHDYDYSSKLNAFSYHMRCKNPISLIKNYGQIYIDGLLVDINLNEQEIDLIKNQIDVVYTVLLFDYEYDRYRSDKASLIRNYLYMEVTNAYFTDSICRYLFYNEGPLLMSDIIVGDTNNQTFEGFDRNKLRSTIIILQEAVISETYVYNSHFQGSSVQMEVFAGIAHAYDTVFEKATVGILAIGADELIVSNCVLQNIGTYYGPFATDNIYASYPLVSIQTVVSNSILLINNTFSSFDPRGLVTITASTNIELTNNLFSVNVGHDIFFYNITEEYINFENPYSPLTVRFSKNITMKTNNFYENELNPSVPWIYYLSNSGINCLSGNKFSNYAFTVTNTNISSCFRKELIKCMSNEDNICIDGMYGNIDQSLYNQVGNFIVNKNINSIFKAITKNSFIALDNINIDSKANKNPLLVDVGNVLFVDSYLNNMYSDITYSNNSCNVVYNDRMITNNNQLSKLMIKCFDSSNNNNNNNIFISETMQSSITRFVDKFSATKINFTTTTNTYFPGQFIKFKYEILDRFDNIVNYNLSDILTIRLEGNTFSAEINIEENGECPGCDNGLFINDIFLDDTHTEYNIKLIVVNDLLLPVQESLSLKIISCPIGYGPNINGHLCQICDTGTYNLKYNNNITCETCDDIINEGIKCISGNIYVATNYWVGFDNNNNIISAKCARDMCCMNDNNNNNNCSYIEETNKLCIEGRDYTSILCSKCKPLYSESMNSTKCVKCNGKHYLSFLLLPFAMAIMLSFYLIVSNSDKIDSNNKSKPKTKRKENKFNNLRLRLVNTYMQNKYFVMMVKIMFATNILYYEQSVSVILSSSSGRVLFETFAAFMFNLSIISYSNNTNTHKLWCFIHGLNAKGKILTDFITSIMIIIIISLLCLILKFVYRKKKEINIKLRTINFTKIMVATFLLLIGKIIEILFRLMHCHKVGNKSVHFWYGYEQCYGITWILSFVFLLIIIISFMLLFLKLSKMTEKERENQNFFGKLVEKYQPKYYYWELIIFVRRILIALFAVSFNSIDYQLLFCLLILFFIYIQYRYQPFVVDEANKMEFILLSCLVFIICSQFPLSFNKIFLNVMISFFIILPFILLMYYGYMVVNSDKKVIRKSNEKPNNLPIISSNDDTLGRAKLTGNHEEVVELVIPKTNDSPTYED